MDLILYYFLGATVVLAQITGIVTNTLIMTLLHIKNKKMTQN